MKRCSVGDGPCGNLVADSLWPTPERELVGTEVGCRGGLPMTTGESDRPDDISAILISLRVVNDQSLFLKIASDGRIMRQGTGSVEDTEHDFFSGKTDPRLFSQLCSAVTPEPPVSWGLPGHAKLQRKVLPANCYIQASRWQRIDDVLELRFGVARPATRGQQVCRRCYKNHSALV